MKKLYLALMCTAGLALAAACGGGNTHAAENDENNATTEQVAEGAEPADQSLAGTTWKYAYNEANDPEISRYEYVLTFEKGGKSTYTITGYDKSGKVDNSVSDKLSGTYTFDGERGTVDYGKRVDPGSFYLDNGKITIEVRYERQTLEQEK